MMPAGNANASLKLEQVPTWDEVQRLVQEGRIRLKKKHFLYVALLAYTGARRCEILNLQVKDLLFVSDGSVEISSPESMQETRVLTTIVIHQLKKRDKTLTRRVPCAKEIRNELRAFTQDKEPEDNVFTFSPATANRILQRAGKLIIGRTVKPKDLRHAFAFRMLETTKNLETTRRFLGHSGFGILQTYLESSQMDLAPELELAITGKKNAPRTCAKCATPIGGLEGDRKFCDDCVDAHEKNKPKTEG